MFTDPEEMEGWIGLVGWTVADYTHEVVTYQL